jgi:PAS domain S-box-containing protein
VRASNRALIRASDEQALLDAVCQIAVELGDCRLAWVGFAEDDAAKTVRPVAFAGHEAGYLSSIRVSWAEDEYGWGPAGSAIRLGQPCVQRREDDPAFAPWRAQAAERGYGAVLGLPLRDEEHTYGALTLYAADPDAFGTPEVDLLSELSGDLGFGLVTLRQRAQRRRLAAVVEQSVDPIVLVDTERHVDYANSAFLRATGATPADVIGQPAADVAVAILGPDGAAALVRTARERRAWLGEVERTREDGTVRHLEVGLTPLHDPHGGFAGEVIQSRDVTALRDAEAELAYAERIQTAQLASLRRISNDATLEEAAQALCGELSTLPFVDIAGVEAFVNGKRVRIIGLAAPDWLPLAAGGELPPELALQQRTIAQSEAWARPVSADTGPFMSVLAAHGIRALAFGPLIHGGHLDGGLILATADPRFARTLVDKMPGLVSFSATTSALLAQRLHTQRGLAERREALEGVLADRAFAPVFQPIVDLASKEVAGYEALTRFTSGERPDQCFADAWAVGLGPELEIATLDAAVTASRRLPAGRWLDLNVSPRLLNEPERVRSITASAGRPIVLEITEHELIDDYAAVRDAVRALGMGVRLAVDDAGAGIANFGHIVELRPDFVKLDIGLVRGVNVDLGRQALVVGMRHFARTAGCRLIAEGLETEEEASTLAGLGVEFGQGYLLGRPEEARSTRGSRSRPSPMRTSRRSGTSRL